MNMTTLEQVASMELSFSITFEQSHQQGQFLRELNAIAEIEPATLIAADEEQMPLLFNEINMIMRNSYLSD